MTMSLCHGRRSLETTGGHYLKHISSLSIQTILINTATTVTLRKYAKFSPIPRGHIRHKGWNIPTSKRLTSIFFQYLPHSNSTTCGINGTRFFFFYTEEPVNFGRKGA